MRRITALITTVLLLVSPMAYGQAQTPAQQLEAGMQALAASRFADAEALFRSVIAADPQLEQAYLALAESLLAQNRGREATIAVTQLAQRMVQSGREGEARDLLGRVLQIDPNFAVAHAILGMALLSLGEYSDAATALNQAMQLGETSTQTRLMLAAAQWEAGQFDEAEATYRQSIETSGGDPIALQQLGSLLLWQGRFEEAVEPLDRSARAAPPTVDLLYDLGRALDGAGQLDPALQVLGQAVASAPTHAQARYAYARLLLRTGNTEQAREQMAEWQRLYQAEQVMLHESKLAAARLERGWTLLNQGQAQEAAEQFRDLPTSVDSLYGLGLSLSAIGDHAGAVQAIENALGLDPERRDIQRRLAVERLAVEGQR